jgi:F-type H+-transporting ATPase subunit a
MASELHISISAERVASLGPLTLSNSIITSLIVSALLIIFFILTSKLAHTSMKKPHPLQNVVEYMIQGFYRLIQGITGDHQKTRFFLPFFLTFFFFILANNWFGLIPGVGTIGFRETETGTQHAVLLQHEIDVPVARAQAATEVSAQDSEATPTQEVPATAESATTEESEASAEPSEGLFIPYFRAGTADLNTTLALAVFTMLMVQVIGVKYQGLKYFGKFFNLKNPIMFFVSILETVSEVAKVLSFSFRLFGNIFAGEVLLVVVGSLIPLIAPMPFYGLEIFVGLIQALVFAMLAIVFFTQAAAGHEEEH